MKGLTKIFFFICFLLINFTMVSEYTTAQWFQQSSGVTVPLTDIEFINRNTGWVCGDGGTILKTTDGGKSWLQQSTGVPSKFLSGIHPIDSNVIYCVGHFETILKSTNGGEEWIQIQNGTWGQGNSYYAVCFTNEFTGFVSSTGMSGSVMKTTNGGQTFISVSTNGTPRDLHFRDDNYGLGVSWTTMTHRTTNSGINWYSVSLGVAGNFYRMSVINESTGYTVGGFKVYKTTNFGITWENISEIIGTPKPFSYAISFYDEITGWVGGSHGELYKTTNGGSNWVKQEIPLVNNIRDIYPYNDSLVWACANGGVIWHTIRGGDTTTSISQISGTVPESFEMYQNYPNPFNNVTKIKFKIKERNNYTLTMIDNLGRNVCEIFNESFEIGMYEVTFDTSEQSTGVYYIRLNSDKNFKTIKSLLIK